MCSCDHGVGVGATFYDKEVLCELQCTLPRPSYLQVVIKQLVVKLRTNFSTVDMLLQDMMILVIMQIVATPPALLDVFHKLGTQQSKIKTWIN